MIKGDLVARCTEPQPLRGSLVILFYKTFVAKVLAHCRAWVRKGGLEMKKAPHTQFFLTKCLINLTYLCHHLPNRGPVLSHSPLGGVEVLDEQQYNVQ